MDKTATRSPFVWAVPLVLLLALGAFLLVSALTNSSTPRSTDAAPPPATQTATPTTKVPDMIRRDDTDPTAIGDVDAPVVMVMYSDFQCGYCAMVHDERLPQLIADYVQPGTLRIEFRDIDVFGPDSRRAALAAYAAGLQGKYLEYSTALFVAADFSDATLGAIATGLGLDVVQFHVDLAAATTTSAVDTNVTEARGLGINSTPTFLVNGTPIIGAVPYEDFASVIDAELAQP